MSERFIEGDIFDEKMGGAHAVFDRLPKGAVIPPEGMLLKKLKLDGKGGQVYRVCTNSKPLAIARLVPSGDKDILEVEFGKEVDNLSDEERGEVFSKAIGGQNGVNIIFSTKK